MKQIKKMIVLAATVFMVMILLPTSTQAATVNLNKKTITLYAGGSTTLKMTGTAKAVKWSSSKSSVAIVSQKGVVTAKKAGTATITVKAGSKKSTCKVTVKKQLSAKQTVAKINRQIKQTNYMTITAYMGSIKKANYFCKMAEDIKKNISYVDMSVLGIPKMYSNGNKVYWYDESSNKWYYYNVTNSGNSNNTSANLITDSMKYKTLGVKTFNGKRCVAMKVTEGTESTIYYVDLADYSLVGITSGSGSEKQIMVIDMKKKVSIPSTVTKNAEYKQYSM